MWFQVDMPSSLVSRPTIRTWRPCWLLEGGTRAPRGSRLWSLTRRGGLKWSVTLSNSWGRTTSMGLTSTGSIRPSETAGNRGTGRTTLSLYRCMSLYAHSCKITSNRAKQNNIFLHCRNCDRNSTGSLTRQADRDSSSPWQCLRVSNILIKDTTSLN